VGVYKITPTRESLTLAAQHYPWARSFLDQDGNFSLEEWEFVQEEKADDLQNLTLVEALIIGPYSPKELDEMSHGKEDQAPYLEFYLDADGVESISEAEAMTREHRRVCFFLHNRLYRQ
jgi:hypothetical protein